MIRQHKHVHCHEMAERKKTMATSSQSEQMKRSGLPPERTLSGKASQARMMPPATHLLGNPSMWVATACTCTVQGRPVREARRTSWRRDLARRHWVGARSNRSWHPSRTCAPTTAQVMVGATRVHCRAQLGAWSRNCTRSSPGLASRVPMSWWGTHLVG
jgi:hypothetical protein